MIESFLRTNMKLSQLNYFIAVCQYHTITKAAEILHVSQPSITASLKELESEFNVNLFQRVNRKMLLTPEGELFYKRACQILKDVEILKEDIADLNESRNHIKLGIPLQIGAFFLPPLLQEFQERYPHIKLEIIECGAKDIVTMILEEKLDMAIASINTDNPKLRYIRLFDTEICFCAEKHHTYADKSFITLEEACAVPSVMLPRGFYTPDAVWEACRHAHLAPDVHLYSLQLHTIKNLIINAGFGSFLLREAVALDEDIVSIPLNPPLHASVVMITKKGRHIYHDSKILISFIMEKYRTQKK